MAWAPSILLSHRPDLPLKSITLRYRQEKARLMMEVRDSTDKAVMDMHAHVVTG